eukprot:2520816-Amphidinium_carterae.1
MLRTTKEGGIAVRLDDKDGIKDSCHHSRLFHSLHSVAILAQGSTYFGSVIIMLSSLALVGKSRGLQWMRKLCENA